MDSITITRNQFRKAVQNANKDFENIISKQDEDNPEGAYTTFLMVLQNLAFSASVEDELFGKEEKEGK